MMIALIPQYIYQMAETATIVGVVLSVFSIAALIIRPGVGIAIDYFKKNLLLAVAIGFIIIAFLCYGVARNVTILIIARLFHGIGVGISIPLCMVLASNVLPEEKMATGISFFTTANALATAIGPTLGMALVSRLNYSYTFFITSAILGISLLLALRIKTKKPERNKRFRFADNKFIVKEVAAPMIMMILFAISFTCVSAFLVIYASARSINNIGLFFSAYAVSLIISRPISGKIADTYGAGKIIIPGIFIFAFSYILLSISSTILAFVLSGVAFAFGYGICIPAIQTLCLQLVDKDKRGAASNMNFFGVDIGSLLGPIIAGFIITNVQEATGIEVLGYVAMYRIMIIPILLAFVVFMFNRRKMLSK